MQALDARGFHRKLMEGVWECAPLARSLWECICPWPEVHAPSQKLVGVHMPLARSACP